MSNAWVSIMSKTIRDQFLQELWKDFPGGSPEVLDAGTSERLAKGFLKGFLNA